MRIFFRRERDGSERLCGLPGVIQRREKTGGGGRMSFESELLTGGMSQFLETEFVFVSLPPNCYWHVLFTVLSHRVLYGATMRGSWPYERTALVQWARMHASPSGFSHPSQGHLQCTGSTHSRVSQALVLLSPLSLIESLSHTRPHFANARAHAGRRGAPNAVPGKPNRAHNFARRSQNLA